jgi:hypothetical protein
MGAWGEGIEESDTVLDVIETFVAQLRSSQSVAAATSKVRQEFIHLFGEVDADPDAIAHARIGLALAQWRYGALEPTLLDEVRADLAARQGIDSYSDAARREKVLRAFVAKLAKLNPKPRAYPKPPKAPRRPPKPKLAAFEAGDCLAMQLPSGVYRAALVLARDRCSDSEEFNVIARLDWQGTEPPQGDVFAAPRVLRIAMHPWAPYKGAARVSVVGRINVDPALFGIEKMPDYWSWQFVRPGEPSRPMTWIGWEHLAGVLP